jgi:Mce-associated membrane protein
MSDPTVGSLRSRTQLVVVVALVVAVIAGAIAVVNAVKLTDGSHASSNPTGTGTSALAATATTAVAEGGQLAVDFTSFDYRTLDQDRTQTASHLTPAFAKVYLAQSSATSPYITKIKAVSVSQVVATGLQAFSPSKHTASVDVALNDTAKNIKSPTGAVTYYRVQVQMVDQNGQWLASNVVLE